MRIRNKSSSGHIICKTDKHNQSNKGNPGIIEVSWDRETGGEMKLEHVAGQGRTVYT